MLTIYTPTLEELWFKQQMMADEATMSYNHAWGGMIPFPKEKWAAWYARWIDNADNRRFYRYLKDTDGKFVGEIAYHFEDERALADVVIYAPERGKGYGSEALEILCHEARDRGVDVLYDSIAIDNPAVNMFLEHGFTEEYRTDEIIMVKRKL